MRRDHAYANPYTCALCGISCFKSSDFHRHMLVHGDVREYHCPQCDYAGRRPRDLRKHMAYHHGGNDTVRTHKKEDLMKDFLKRKGYDFSSQLYTRFQDGAGYAFIDFVVRMPHVDVFLEVDEHQHSLYDQVKECSRVMQVYEVNKAAGKRVTFIRFNPDVWRVDGATVKIAREERFDTLAKVLSSISHSPYTFRVLYMFYDLYNNELACLSNSEIPNEYRISCQHHLDVSA